MFRKRTREVVSLQVMSDLCSGCGRCAERCRRQVFGMKHSDDRAVAIAYHPERCSGCGKCAQKCQAIELTIV